MLIKNSRTNFNYFQTQSTISIIPIKKKIQKRLKKKMNIVFKNHYTFRRLVQKLNGQF